jgi:uracil-DNA glycosylase
MSGSNASSAEPAFDRLVAEIRTSDICRAHLPRGPRPIVRGRPSARLLIIGQAPGTRAHETGLSFNDTSGDRLRTWLALDRDQFYDETRVAILPMGFSDPGRDGKGGDLPPRPECTPRWHSPFRALLPDVALTLLVGGYAIRHYLPEAASSVTEAITRWRDFLPAPMPLRHSSRRTTRWQRDHIERRARVADALPRNGRRYQAARRRVRRRPGAGPAAELRETELIRRAYLGEIAVAERQPGGFIATSSMTLGKTSRITPRSAASSAATAAATRRRDPRRSTRAVARPSRPGRIVANASAGSTRFSARFSA